MADRFRTNIDWEDVRFFAALARHGSLSAAARALAVNHATVARRVAALERSLGTTLMERRSQGYVLTAAGQHALEAAGIMQAASLGLSRSGGRATLAGHVRITVTPSLADAFLISRLTSLRRRHPLLDIELMSDRRPVSLARHEADLAVRIGRLADSDLIARRLVTLGFGLYANRDWRRRLAAGAAPELVGFDEAASHLTEAQWLARQFPGCRLAFQASSQVSQALAARAGLGIALLPHFVARSTDGLVPVLTDIAPLTRDLWLLTRRDFKTVLPVRHARDFIIELFEKEQELFEAPSSAL
jgi:DNA-binding transcriptional LysR family regulator